MVFLGLNISESLVTRGSGTSTTAVWTSKRPAEAVVGVLPRVNALKIVVLPDWGSPMIPSFMFSFSVGRVDHTVPAVHGPPSLTFVLRVVYFGAPRESG